MEATVNASSTDTDRLGRLGSGLLEPSCIAILIEREWDMHRAMGVTCDACRIHQ
jgi:hypothetical protein